MTVIIAHAAWDPARRATLDRLMGQLDDDAIVLRSSEPERPHVWARRCWEKAARLEGDVVLLQDDVEVCPRFRATVAAARCRSFDAPILSLHTTLPVAPSLAFLGEHYVRSWWVTTPGYVLGHGVANRLLRWLDRVPAARVATWNDDHIVMRFAWANREQFGAPWSTIPALVRHDTRVASTFGYDGHANRTTNVPWDATAWEGGGVTPRSPDWWVGVRDPVTVACPWADRRWLASTELELARGLSGEQCWACEAEAAVRLGTVLLCRRCVALAAVRTIDPGLVIPPVWATRRS